jgi:CRISPR-associated endonuclease/helicase Cas3
VARLLSHGLPPWLTVTLSARAGVCLAALHDVGKVTPGFQRKCTPWLACHGLSAADLAGEEDHAKVSQKTLQELLGADSALRFWAAIVGAHHGRLKGEHLTPLSCGHDGGPAWMAERRRLVEALVAEFGPLPSDPPPGLEPWNSPALWFNAGLIAVADWLASDERTFPPSKVLTPTDIEERALRQLDTIGFGALALPAGRSFAALFGFSPLPLQVATAGSASAPGIYVVEGPMGCGKTEAALAVAYALISSGRATGLYFALPTQTTSNRIHRRVADWLERLVPGTGPRLIHGSSWLRQGCEAASGTTEGNPTANEGRHDGRDWFASSRRALLAPFGVGTVDQALLGVVAAKHFFVRQFALAGKVVVLDEVHSYDLYTGTLIDVLVRRLRELGATVIVLSATLTAARRRALLGLADSAAISAAYPLLSLTRDGEPGVLECAIPAGPSKAVQISFPPPAGLAESCLVQAERGECVLWIRNTVDGAQETYRQLRGLSRQGGPDIALLHSRFPHFRREQLEDEWMERLGKDGARRPANGCVLVSTQVAEQSVDIDADLLITDMAPTDMLLQRIGRLWRHDRVRPPGAECQVWIAAPPLDAGGLRNAAAREIRDAFGKSAKVYAPYVLLRSLDQWRQRERLELPTDIRPLLEATYADLPDEPEAWRELRHDLEKRKAELHQTALANSNPWQVQLDDEEGVQTRWNGQPTALLLPAPRLWELPGQGTRMALGIELLDGTPCEVRSGVWDIAVARAIHRNLIKVPKWTVRAGVRHEMSWLREYVKGEVAFCRLMPDGTLCFLPSGEDSCLRYQAEQGVIIRHASQAAATAWTSREADDDEFDE